MKGIDSTNASPRPTPLYSPYFSQIYKFPPILVLFRFFFNFNLHVLWPWCIYASCLTRVLDASGFVYAEQTSENHLLQELRLDLSSLHLALLRKPLKTSYFVSDSTDLGRNCLWILECSVAIPIFTSSPWCNFCRPIWTLNLLSLQNNKPLFVVKSISERMSISSFEMRHTACQNIQNQDSRISTLLTAKNV